MTGTHRGPWVGIPASGCRIDLTCLYLFVFEGDRLDCEKVHFNMVTPMRQVRALA